jgi:hypothetical protein
MSLSKRELFIRDSIGLDEQLVVRVSDISKQLNTNKYSVWIAKESKKDNSILDNYQLLSDIVDWAKATSADIMSFDIMSADAAQQEWHINKAEFPKIKQKMETQEIDEDRVVFVTSQGDHFFYILSPDDLKYESDHMLHCIGWKNSDQEYKRKITEGKSVILSLRNEENMPLLTIEIDEASGKSIQVRGKKNQDLSDLSNKIKRSLSEFVLFAGDFKETESSKILDIINGNLNYF